MATSPQSPVARNVLRVLGIVLVLGGLFLAIKGGFAFADDGSSTPFGESDTTYSSDPGFGPFAMLAGGLFMVVFGLGALNAGFLGAQANYMSRETSGAVREFGSSFRGEPQGGASAAGASGEPAKTGKFCSECGVRNDGGARFCDSCGHALAPA